NRNLDENLSQFMHKAAYTGGLDFTQYQKEKLDEQCKFHSALYRDLKMPYCELKHHQRDITSALTTTIQFWIQAEHSSEDQEGEWRL
ncbi:MAG: hypothetical protein IPN68_18500, partial [Bacteroidetes bacterium]|nr:hypothetical protein [Bacteroidota bacterium]